MISNIFWGFACLFYQLFNVFKVQVMNILYTVFVGVTGRCAGDQWRSLHRVWDHSVLLGASTYKFSGGFLQSPETQPKPGKITC